MCTKFKDYDVYTASVVPEIRIQMTTDLGGHYDAHLQWFVIHGWFIISAK